MKIKELILAGLLALSMFCACNDNTKNNPTNTEAINTEASGSSGNFSETIIIENPSTDTVIVEMP